jgi:hypothetical protein
MGCAAANAFSHIFINFSDKVYDLLMQLKQVRSRLLWPTDNVDHLTNWKSFHLHLLNGNKPIVLLINSADLKKKMLTPNQ